MKADLMDFKSLKKFIKKQDERLRKQFPYEDEEKLVFARAVKMTEEMGELCDEVLSFSSRQRKEKMEKHNPDNLNEEFADVVITVFLLANAMGVDISKSLDK